jgi:hypothetical protein
MRHEGISILSKAGPSAGRHLFPRFDELRLKEAERVMAEAV